MAAAGSAAPEQLRACCKVLQAIMAHPDAALFLEPVDWKGWGLHDYPKVIKTPMDLGTVKRKLDAGTYGHPREFKHDVSLVWSNCMTYNAEGSGVYNQAAQLKKIFEERYAKAVKDEVEESHEHIRPPTLADKKMLSQNVYNIAPEDLGRVVQILDQRCERCIKKIDPEDIEIDVDAIDDATFWAVDAFIKDCLPGGKKATKKKAGAAAGGGAAGDAPPRSKKARGAGAS